MMLSNSHRNNLPSCEIGNRIVLDKHSLVPWHFKVLQRTFLLIVMLSVWDTFMVTRFSVVTPQLIQFPCRLATVSHLLTILAFPLLVRFLAKPGEINPPQHYLIYFSTSNFPLPWLTNKENNIIYYNFHRDHLFLGSRCSRSPHRVGLSAKCVSFTSAGII